jgi:hypothetical protein
MPKPTKVTTTDANMPNIDIIWGIYVDLKTDKRRLKTQY